MAKLKKIINDNYYKDGAKVYPNSFATINSDHTHALEVLKANKDITRLKLMLEKVESLTTEFKDLVDAYKNSTPKGQDYTRVGYFIDFDAISRFENILNLMNNESKEIGNQLRAEKVALDLISKTGGVKRLCKMAEGSMQKEKRG